MIILEALKEIELLHTGEEWMEFPNIRDGRLGDERRVCCPHLNSVF